MGSWLNAVKLVIKRNAINTETLHHKLKQVLSLMNATCNIVIILANRSEIQYEEVEGIWDTGNMLLDQT